MKKITVILIIVLILILASICFGRIASPVIAYDPNEIIANPDTVTINIKVTITAEQYAAMQYLDLTLIDVVKKSRLSRTLDNLIKEAKIRMTENVKLTDLKAKLEAGE